MRARRAAVDDAAAIARIYNEGIEDRIATFETRLRTEEEVRGWFGSRYPIAVAEDGGQVVAFASTCSYSARPCYAHIAEFSVYTARKVRRRGAGALVLSHLFDLARERGLAKLVSRVFVENGPSRALLVSLGFREVGIHERHAELDGKWRDVVVVERLL